MPFTDPPNVVVDVFCSKDDPDFLRRRERFCQFGVHEYLVAVEDDLLWHRLDAGCYRPIRPIQVVGASPE